MAQTIQDFRAFKKEGEIRLPFSLQLLSPVTMGSETVEELVFTREPTAGDIASLPSSGTVMGDYYRPLSKVLGQPEALIKKLSFRDFKNAMELFNHFLSDSDEDGEEI